jgi:hypothetical protein
MLLDSALSTAARRRVRGRIAAAQTRCRHQLANDFGKDLTALGILCRFAVFGVGPLTMTCHKNILKERAFSGSVNYKFFNRLPVAPRLGQCGGIRRIHPAVGQVFGEHDLPFMGSARQNHDSVLRSVPGA